ncbi:MAG: hypothetical protein J5382_03565 [Bacteroidales bacterium]|nr:hypothetical protein [Bacteroidales bacterium]
MKRIAIIAAVLAFMFQCITAIAQDYPEYDRFAEEAGEMSMLYRGKQGMSYSFPYNGTYYWYGRDFRRGDVFYNGKLYRNAFVNVNAHLQELLVKEDEDYLPVLVDTGHVEWFTMGDRRFLPRDAIGLPSLPDGFYEVLFDGQAKLYKRVDKILRKDANNRNGSGIGYDDPNYNDKVQDYFANRVSYYFIKDGEIHSVRKWRGIVSCFPERKKELKRYAKDAMASNPDFDALAAAILKYAEADE